jgi:hypothetical protein
MTVSASSDAVAPEKGVASLASDSPTAPSATGSAASIQTPGERASPLNERPTAMARFREKELLLFSVLQLNHTLKLKQIQCDIRYGPGIRAVVISPSATQVLSVRLHFLLSLA